MQSSIGQPMVAAQQHQNSYQAPPAPPYVQPQVNYNTQAQVQTAMPQPQANNVQVPPNYSGVNIQIFNPSVATPGSQAPTYNVNAPTYPQQQGPSSYGAGYYTNNYGCGCGANGLGANSAMSKSASNAEDTSTKTTSETNKKTEKRNIVVLTDEYIKNLENYLNSQDKEIRLMGAKEVIARLEEDNSRKDDKALNALVNKMLQDPSQQVKILALAALDSRVASGDAYTVEVLKNMQNATTGYGQDALQASNILLKMSGQVAEKEFEVKNNKTTETKTETKTTTKG